MRVDRLTRCASLALLLCSAAALPAVGATYDMALAPGPGTGVARPVLPGDHVLLSVTVTNIGDITDSYYPTLWASPVWPQTLTSPATFTLAPGQSTQVTWTVDVPADAGGTFMVTKVHSNGAPGFFRRVDTTLYVPLTMTVTLPKTTFTYGEAHTGRVCLAFQTGAPAPNVFMTAFDTTAPNADLARRTFTSGADGCASYSRCEDVFHLILDGCGPGNHRVCITTTRQGHSERKCYDWVYAPPGA